jgi:hypothetical protein
MVDTAIVHNDGLGLRGLRAPSSTSTVAAEDLVNVDPVGDGV